MKPLEPERQDKAVRRLEELLETVQRELLDLDTDFQVRLRESVQNTESKAREQFAIELAARMKQTEEEARKATTGELLQRFEVEFRKRSAEFEEKGRNAIAMAESAANLRLEQAQTETERVRNDLEREMELAAKKAEGERQNLLLEVAKLGEELDGAKKAAASKAGLEKMEASLSAELAQQKARFEEELSESAKRWDAERSTLKGDFDRSRQQLIVRFDVQIQELQRGFQNQRVKEIADSEAAAEIRLKHVLAEATEEFQRREEHLQAAANETLQNTSSQFQANIERLDRRILTLEGELAKTKDEERGRTPLSKELEAKLQDLAREKQALSEEFKAAATAWKQERESLLSKSPTPAGGNGKVSGELNAEISDIEKLLSDIAAKVENPSLDLAAEIRLNQERIRLENYMKGLRYAVDGTGNAGR